MAPLDPASTLVIGTNWRSFSFESKVFVKFAVTYLESTERKASFEKRWTK